MTLVSGCVALVRALQRNHVRHVFSVPGTQNVGLYEALRASSLRTITATNELAASFMANGYARASGEPGVLLTIPGPGFLFALPGLAEARLDSVPLVHVVVRATDEPLPRFQLQDIDQVALAAPLAKRVIEVERVFDLIAALDEAFDVARGGEPGPVVVQVGRSVLEDLLAVGALTTRARAATQDAQAFEAPWRALEAARRVVIYAGLGVQSAAAELARFAHWLHAPVVLTSSARGALADDHPLAIPLDRVGERHEALNELLQSADLVLALGVKLGHNGTAGFRIKLRESTLVRLDASPAVLAANMPARLSVAADVPAFLRWWDVLPAERRGVHDGWTPSELEPWRKRLLGPRASDPLDPVFHETTPNDAAGFFQALRRVLPREALVVTDSGLHQMLARAHFPVLAPRSLIVPTDLQSMGFGLAAALGAKLVSTAHPVVALLGDGGFSMSGLELLTSVREQLPLCVIVFNDGQLNLIRRKQLAESGHDFGTRVTNPDFELLARSLGVRYARLSGPLEDSLARAMQGGGSVLIEVRLQDADAASALRNQSRLRTAAEQVLGPKNAEHAKRTLLGWLRR